jgi:hypothetical protein
LRHFLINLYSWSLAALVTSACSRSAYAGDTPWFTAIFMDVELDPSRCDLTFWFR